MKDKVVEKMKIELQKSHNLKTKLAAFLRKQLIYSVHKIAYNLSKINTTLLKSAAAFITSS